jgi:pyruvate dehydrogenase E2 component (dihydrolipoamide acetyltransferase)
MAVEVFIPKMSDHMESGEIIGWLVEEGDVVEAGQGIVEIMTDKATAEIESPVSGIVKAIRPGVGRGVVLPVGEVIAVIGGEDEEVMGLSVYGAEGEAGGERVSGEAGTVVTPVARRVAERLGIDLGEVGSGPGGRIRKEDVLAFKEAGDRGLGRSGRVFASPAAYRCARELGVDISLVRGRGPGGLVRERDVRGHHERAAGVYRKAPAEGTFEYRELTTVQRSTGIRMLESVRSVPQFFLSLGVDMERLLMIRELLMERVEAESGRRLSITALLIKVVAVSLVRYPRANASYEEGRLRMYRDINIGVAVGGSEGLVVPVVREADKKTVVEINGELKVIEEKARGMKFRSEDLAGGHFTVSNLGMYGIERFNAIVNPPQSAILAVGRVMSRPAGTADGRIVLRKMMELTLTVDHRCMDGVQGAEFLGMIKKSIEKPDIFLA